MPHDPVLADRLRAALAGEPDVVEKRMFGGVSFMVDGRLTVGAAHTGGLMVRCAPDRVDELLLLRPGAARMVMRGRVMSAGWLVVDPAAVESDVDLRFWVDEALAGTGA